MHSATKWTGGGRSDAGVPPRVGTPRFCRVLGLKVGSWCLFLFAIMGVSLSIDGLDARRICLGGSRGADTIEVAGVESIEEV